MASRTLEDFCDGLMTDDEPMARLEPEGFASEFATFFGLSGRPTLAELAETFERAGIGEVSPAKLPGDLRGIHYPLPEGGRAIHYQEGQWEASSEYTVLHEGYEIVYEALWLRCHGETSTKKVCPEADRFAAAVLMPPETFAAYALASGLDVVALKKVFRCSYSAVAIRLGEVMNRQPLLAVLYERNGQGDPACWSSPTRLADLRVTVIKRTTDFGTHGSRLLNGWRGGIPRKGKTLSAGSLAEETARSGRPEYAESDGIAVAATPVLWKGRLAKVIVVAVPWEQRQMLEAQLGKQGKFYPRFNTSYKPREARRLVAG